MYPYHVIILLVDVIAVVLISLYFVFIGATFNALLISAWAK